MFKKIELIDEKEIALIERVNHVFVTQGLKKVTMDDMAKELCVSKKTLYRYVKNRSELVEKSTYFHLERDKLKIKGIEELNLNPMEEMYQIAQYAMQTIGSMDASVHHDLMTYFPASWARLQEYFGGFVKDSIKGNIERGKAEGIYDKDVNSEIIARLFIAKLDVTFDGNVFPAKEFKFGDVYLTYVKHHLKGIASLKGLELLEKLKFNTTN